MEFRVEKNPVKAIQATDECSIAISPLQIVQIELSAFIWLSTRSLCGLKKIDKLMLTDVDLCWRNECKILKAPNDYWLTTHRQEVRDRGEIHYFVEHKGGMNGNLPAIIMKLGRRAPCLTNLSLFRIYYPYNLLKVTDKM